MKYICGKGLDMRFRLAVLYLVALSVLVACGSSRAVVRRDLSGKSVSTTEDNRVSEKTPLQTSFLGIKFGDSPSRVYNKLFRLHPIKGKDGSYSVYGQQFAGYNWNLMKVLFAEKRLYSVNFQNPFTNENAANERFQSVYKMLKSKYGEMETTSSGNGFQYVDSGHNLVIVSMNKGLSQGGKEYWYCELSYFWGPGLIVDYVKALNEI